MSLEILTSDLLDGVKHGFFTRRGGASSGVFDGLNCGYGSTDQSDIVTINRGRVADAMGVSIDKLRGVHQIHSADVVHAAPTDSDTSPRADGIVTDRADLALVILTADCQPVLFADRDAGVIAASHAGWRGALDGILGATIDAMEELGAKRRNIHAVIGPSISKRAYEVGPEFRDDFIARDPANARFFDKGVGDRHLFDLPEYGLHKLREAGVGAATWTGHCTYSDPALFYSYRRSVHRKEADYGRLISAIRL